MLWMGFFQVEGTFINIGVYPTIKEAIEHAKQFNFPGACYGARKVGAIPTMTYHEAQKLYTSRPRRKK